MPFLRFPGRISTLSRNTLQLMTQIMKRHIMNKRAMPVLPLLGLGAVATALSGCGGASTNVGGISAPTPNYGPVIYGINAAAASSGASIQGETSGLSFTATTGTGATATTTTEGVITGATSYHIITGTGPLPVYQSTFPNGVMSNGSTSSPGVPLGFAPSGTYYNSSVPVAALPTNYTGSLIFGADISTGAVNKTPADLNTGSVVLTSSEAPGFSVPLAFNKGFGTGVLAQDPYQTPPFAMPAFLQTTGLHDLHTIVADVAGQSSTTDFAVATVAPTDVALFFQSFEYWY